MQAFLPKFTGIRLLNLHFIKHLFRHYLQATPMDVLHSPFIFRIYQSCIKRQSEDAVIQKMEGLRKKLQSDRTVLHYQDYGAAQKSQTTTVSQIARTHLKPPRLAKILYRLAQYHAPKSVVELGTSLGLSTTYLALGVPMGTRVYTIEGSPEIQQQALKLFEQAGVTERIQSLGGTFDEVLPELLNRFKQLDFVFIDGNHSYEATIRYFKWLKPYLHNDSILIFDDIYWSPGMTRAWEEIKQDAEVSVSVDLFFLGLVYFRKEQAKQHFRLRVN